MKRFMLWGIGMYQKYLSPLKRTRCPYSPTCSQYSKEAIEKYGALKGGLLAVWRILRCNPLFKGGVDPVPEFKRIKYKRKYADPEDLHAEEND